MESFLKHLVRMRIVEQSLQATYLHLGLHGLGFPIILRLRSLDTDSLPPVSSIESIPTGGRTEGWTEGLTASVTRG